MVDAKNFNFYYRRISHSHSSATVTINYTHQRFVDCDAKTTLQIFKRNVDIIIICLTVDCVCVCGVSPHSATYIRINQPKPRKAYGEKGDGTP